eukprot:1423465-Rhodomonas_salina.1
MSKHKKNANADLGCSLSLLHRNNQNNRNLPEGKRVRVFDSALKNVVSACQELHAKREREDVYTSIETAVSCTLALCSKYWTSLAWHARVQGFRSEVRIEVLGSRV